jgi:hypothetical protein
MPVRQPLAHVSEGFGRAVIRRPILDADGVKGLDTFSTFPALTAVQAIFRADAGKGQFQRQISPHADYLFFRHLPERRADRQLRAKTFGQQILHVSIELRCAIGERIGTQWCRGDLGYAPQDAINRSLSEKNDVATR